MNRSILYSLLFAIGVCSFGSCSSDVPDDMTYKVVGPTVIEDEDDESQPTDWILTLADANATVQTKALYSNLWKIQQSGFMFGHHDDLWYGRYWYNEPGKSDTKEVCGDYPAVFSVDFATIMDNRAAGSTVENDIRRRVILEAYARGEVITACCHLNNPLTGGDSWDNSNTRVVAQILEEGTATNVKFMGWLDNLANFANNLKDNNGALIPIIFRPFHEHTQEWSWWGVKCTTEQEFVAFWKKTIEYLRDTKGVSNFIYAISPQMDAVYPDAKSRLLTRWPGDEYVDFIGMDCYHGLNVDAFKSNLKALGALSIEKRKPCGVTETGHEGFTNTDYWTKNVFDAMVSRGVCMVVMWRNKYVGVNESDKHFYSVYPGHPSQDNFVEMYNKPQAIFSGELPDMYTVADGVTVN